MQFFTRRIQQRGGPDERSPSESVPEPSWDTRLGREIREQIFEAEEISVGRDSGEEDSAAGLRYLSQSRGGVHEGRGSRDGTRRDLEVASIQFLLWISSGNLLEERAENGAP